MRNFTRLWNLEMQRMEAECPNTFFLIPGSRSVFNPKNWFSQDYKLYLMCQHPPGPHCVDDEYGYDLRQPQEWWVKVSPWLKHLLAFLKFGIPLIQPVGNLIDTVDVDFKKVEAQLTLLEKIAEALPELEAAELASPSERILQPGREPSVEPVLRFLHSFLEKADPQRFWGGLVKRVTPDGNILWLCSTHSQPYEPQLLSLNP